MENDFFKFIEMKKDEEEIQTDQFIIKNNILKFDHLTIQLSNISRIYAGTKPMKLPKIAIAIFILSIWLIRFESIRWLSIVSMGLSAFYIYTIYQKYQENKEFLIFQLNSGDNYYLYFQDIEFLHKVRKAVEVAFNHKNIYSEINIAEQKIIQGDHHIIKGNNANLNTGTQIGNTLHSNNYEEHSTTTLGDIKDSTIQNATIGNQNCQKNYSDFYDWNVLEANLKAVIVTLNNEVGGKQICNEALKAVKEKNREKFEKIIKNNRAFFTSPLFLNTASGVLAQMFSAILGI
ncbi:hypothetical protein KI126_002679 [Enterococcus faecium]|nr:hypothetical protein [Enterococcus faecalis]EHK9412246.1 hypothetical protein [Enterococcus faecalis]EHQ8833468.1 hypothetical protein [Enterococcus faecalis]EMF0280603.1 hypothetical protein [Enterococcus faecium]